MPIDGRKSHGSIVKELITEFKSEGKIGNTTPDDMEHAMKIANAIAYDVKGTAKTEALKSHIQSLIRPENKAFLENVILKGFDACFESDLDTESDEIVRMDTDAMSSEEIDTIQTQLDDIKEDKAEVERQQEEINEKEEDLINTSAALSLNESKSKEASAVLQLMDKDYSYQDALKKVLGDNPEVKKGDLEKELNTYI